MISGGVRSVVQDAGGPWTPRTRPYANITGIAEVRSRAKNRNGATRPARRRDATKGTFRPRRSAQSPLGHCVIRAATAVVVRSTPAHAAYAANGARIPHASTTAPPTTGPRICPTRSAFTYRPMYRPRIPGGTVFARIARLEVT